MAKVTTYTIKTSEKNSKGYAISSGINCLKLWGDYENITIELSQEEILNLKREIDLMIENQK